MAKPASKLLNRHKGRIGVSAKAYRERHLMALARKAAGRKAIYLDLNYWIDLQRASSGAAREVEHAEILKLLREAVSEGEAFCPPSAGLFMEIGKQRDRESRIALGRLIDELSAGIGLVADDDVVAVETAHMVHAVLARKPLGPPRDQIWVPLGCMVGDATPPIPPLGTRQRQQLMEKAWFDTLVAAKAEDLLAAESDDTRGAWADLARDLSEGSRAHAHEATTFEALLDAELRGAADASAEIIKVGGVALFDQPTMPGAREMTPEAWAKTIYLTLRASPDARKAVPSLYVRAGLHALVRWNRTQKFKPNDIHDFAHAAAALGYCDIFLTEGPLKDLLGRGPLKLRDASGCRVASAPAEALALVTDLLERS